MRLIHYLAFVILFILAASCNNASKPKPLSKDITKTAITVDGKKDSVINNPDKSYTKVATVPDPCVKCLIAAVQQTTAFKQLKVQPSDIKYEINWVPASTSADTASKGSATNGLKLDAIDKTKANAVLASFLYDNTAGKLFYIKKSAKTEINVDAVTLKKIRRVCYWGVASAK